jgi:hypothetical protein
MSLLSNFTTSRQALGHNNNMPATVRNSGIQLAQALSPYMNNCQIADTLDVTESTIRRWRITSTPQNG